MTKEKNKKSEKTYEKDFIRDLKQIISCRTSVRFELALRNIVQQASKLYIKAEGNVKSSHNKEENNFYKNMEDLYSRLYKDEINIFCFGEMGRFKKKHKEDMPSTYSNAKNGEDTSLWKLIKWDKSWLFVDWVKFRILEKETTDDHLFFSRLSDAVKKNTRFSLKSKSGSRRGTIEKTLNLVKIMQTINPLSEYGDRKKLFKDLHQILDENGDLKDIDKKPKRQVQLLTSNALKNLKPHGSIFKLRKAGEKVDEIFKILFPNISRTKYSFSELAKSVDNIKRGDTKHEKKIIENLAKDIVGSKDVEVAMPLDDKDYFIRVLKRHGLKN